MDYVSDRLPTFQVEMEEHLRAIACSIAGFTEEEPDPSEDENFPFDVLAEDLNTIISLLRRRSVNKVIRFLKAKILVSVGLQL